MLTLTIAPSSSQSFLRLTEISSLSSACTSAYQSDKLSECLLCVLCVLCEGLSSALCRELETYYPACVWGLGAKVPDTTNTQNKQNRRLFMVGMQAFPQCLACGIAGFKLHLKPNCYHKAWVEQKNNVFQPCGIFFSPPLLSVWTSHTPLGWISARRSD